MLKPGNTNADVTKVIAKINESFKVNAMDGVLSHNLEKHSIDGTHSLVAKESYDQKVDKHEF